VREGQELHIQRAVEGVSTWIFVLEMMSRIFVLEMITSRGMSHAIVTIYCFNNILYIVSNLNLCVWSMLSDDRRRSGWLIGKRRNKRVLKVSWHFCSIRRDKHHGRKARGFVGQHRKTGWEGRVLIVDCCYGHVRWEELGHVLFQGGVPPLTFTRASTAAS